MNFDTIEYLQTGTLRQQEAYSVLTLHRVMNKLEVFTPLLTGTLPINIDIETSDLDIICYWTNKPAFYTTLIEVFRKERGFTIRESSSRGQEAVIANFNIEGFEIEIFGQNIPTKQQMAYRHMIIEHQLLTKHGEDFRQKVISLKREGYKTEPAFGKLLGLQGNPYDELLNFEKTGYAKSGQESDS